MTEPTTVAAGAIATASTLTLAILGVDYYSLIWSMVGTFGALYWREQKLGSVRSVIYVALSTLVGAAAGTGAMALIGSSVRALLIGMSLVAGFGAQALLQAMLEAWLHRINKFGGEK